MNLRFKIGTYSHSEKFKNKIKYYKREMKVDQNHKTIRVLLKAKISLNNHLCLYKIIT